MAPYPGTTDAAFRDGESRTMILARAPLALGVTLVGAAFALDPKISPDGTLQRLVLALATIPVATLVLACAAAIAWKDLRSMRNRSLQ